LSGVRQVRSALVLPTAILGAGLIASVRHALH
jgi:hypothetical protein